MNNTDCQRISFDFSGKFLPPVYILVFIVGLVANGWGLKALLQNWKKMGNVNIFVLNLGLADFLYLLTLPFLVSYHLMKNRWIFGDVVCKITRFCFNLNLYGSIGFLTCISVYRYLAIVHPMRAMGRITVAHSVGISLTVWLFVAVQSLPEMFYSKTYGNRTVKCYDTTSDRYMEDYLRYSLGRTLTGFCIPFLVTLGCYGHGILLLCRTKTADKVLKRRCLKLLCILILLFVVCYVPHHIFKNLNLWSRVLARQKMCRGWFNGVFIAHQMSRGLVCLNSALNPLVYFHADGEITAELRSRVRRGRQMIQCVGLDSTRESISQNTCEV
ncbi:P2Y purinoceptor 1 [Gasterosteus aculeatus]